MEGTECAVIVGFGPYAFESYVLSDRRGRCRMAALALVGLIVMAVLLTSLHRQLKRPLIKRAACRRLCQSSLCAEGRPKFRAPIR
jgi:hypothetical protein